MTTFILIHMLARLFFHSKTSVSLLLLLLGGQPVSTDHAQKSFKSSNLAFQLTRQVLSDFGAKIVVTQ